MLRLSTPVRTFATRLAVLRTGDALLGYGGMKALFKKEEGDSELALVAVEADDSPDTLFDGVNDESLFDAADAVLEGYGEDIEATPEAASVAAAKLVPGAAARARFDSVTLTSSAAYGNIAGPGLRYSGPARLWVTVVRVGGEEDGTVDVRVRGRASDNDDLGVVATLVEEDEDGYVAAVARSRVETYAPFYALNPRAPRTVLRHAVALVWPEPVAFDRVTVSREGGVFDILDGDVAISVDGRDVPLSDPTYAVVPREKRFVGVACFGGGLLGLVGSFLAAHPAVGGSPLFLLGALPAAFAMSAGTRWTSVWRALPPECGGPDRPPLSRMKQRD